MSAWQFLLYHVYDLGNGFFAVMMLIVANRWYNLTDHPKILRWKLRFVTEHPVHGQPVDGRFSKVNAVKQAGQATLQDQSTQFFRVLAR